MNRQIGGEGSGDKSEIAAIDAEIAERIRDVEKAARAWGVRPDHLEGKFVAAWLSATKTLSGLIRVAASDVKEIIGGAKEVAELELEKLRKYNMAAAMTIRQAEVAKEAVIVNVTKGLTDRLISESQKWLILKQTDYNRRMAWRLAGVVSVCAVVLFQTGYQLRGWQDEPATSALGKCAARPLLGTEAGQTVILCHLDELSLRPLSAVPGALKEWAESHSGERGLIGWLFQEDLGEDEDLKREDEAGHPSKEADISFGVADFEFEPVFDASDFRR